MIVQLAAARSDFDFREIPETASIQEIIAQANKAINFLSFFNKSLSIQSNFNGYISENVVVPAASEVSIQHFLGVVPKWRIILRQTGNGVITDVNSKWSNKIIALYNNGAEDVTISIFIARE